MSAVADICCCSPPTNMLATHTNVCCNKKSRIEDHGQQITNLLLSECNLSDDKIAAFIAKTCKNFLTVVDHQVCDIAKDLHRRGAVS